LPPAVAKVGQGLRIESLPASIRMQHGFGSVEKFGYPAIVRSAREFINKF